MWFRFKPYVSVAKRQANAAKEIKKLEQKGQKAWPVRIEGRKIAHSFWGKSWCDNLESYSDYSNRLPRGRRYVRNGSVCDLQIQPGMVTALVCGSELYKIKITIDPVTPECWKAVKRECSGQIGAVIELLQGKFSDSVMQVITRPDTGLFPKPKEIKLQCSCPDWAGMCKHVAAVMYGVGARLDEKPELLFTLRQLDPMELVTDAAAFDPLTTGNSNRKTIDSENLSDVFGIEMAPPPSGNPIGEEAAPAAKKVRKTKRHSLHARDGRHAKKKNSKEKRVVPQAVKANNKRDDAPRTLTRKRRSTRDAVSSSNATHF